MNKVSGLVPSLLVLFGVLFSQNCATLIRSSTQKFPVTSSPAGATIFIDGVKQGVTPQVIRLDRKWKGQVIRIESPGYNPVEIRLKRKLSGGGIIGNFLFGIAAGYVTTVFFAVKHHEEEDVRAGAITLMWATAAAITGGFALFDLTGKGKGYAFRPIEITVTLKKADGIPRVDTMFFDADDFKNINWIRVHRD